MSGRGGNRPSRRLQNNRGAGVRSKERGARAGKRNNGARSNTRGEGSRGAAGAGGRAVPFCPLPLLSLRGESAVSSTCGFGWPKPGQGRQRQSKLTSVKPACIHRSAMSWTTGAGTVAWMTWPEGFVPLRLHGVGLSACAGSPVAARSSTLAIAEITITFRITLSPRCKPGSRGTIRVPARREDSIRLRPSLRRPSSPFAILRP